MSKPFISTGLTGKMEAVWSLSTNCMDNPYCRARAKNPETVCSICYAMATVKTYRNASARYSENYKLLTSRVLSDEEFERIKREIFRIESFGDLYNWIQAANYTKFIALNPDTAFSWFTKNPVFIKQSIERGYAKPDNVTIIYSNPYINRPITLEEIQKTFPFIDKVFNVVTKEYAEEHGIEINCGARSCNGCRTCYTKDGAKVIYELAKKR